jgi:hypothetical protein
MDGTVFFLMRRPTLTSPNHAPLTTHPASPHLHSSVHFGVNLVNSGTPKIEYMGATQTPSHVSRQPRLGLFWFIAKGRNASRFAAFSQLLNNVPEIDDFRKINENHFDAWSVVQRLDSSLSPYEFDYFPRGRVDFFRPGRRWLLSLDPKLRRGAFVAYIVLQWGIPPRHLTVNIDRDYQSRAHVGPPA